MFLRDDPAHASYYIFQPLYSYIFSLFVHIILNLFLACCFVSCLSLLFSKSLSIHIHRYLHTQIPRCVGRSNGQSILILQTQSDQNIFFYLVDTDGIEGIESTYSLPQHSMPVTDKQIKTDRYSHTELQIKNKKRESYRATSRIYRYRCRIQLHIQIQIHTDTEK